MTRQQVIDALRASRREQLIHGHDWDVRDVIDTLDKYGIIDTQQIQHLTGPA